MARRRGSGRGRSAVNSRKSALENAREKLKDDPGGTRGQHNHNSNMEAAAATTTTAQATTKHLGGKNKQLLNNHHRSLDRRSVNSNSNSNNSSSNSNNNATAASASAGSSSSNSAAHRKHNNTNSLQQTYRVSGETHGGGGGSAVGAGAGAEKAPKQTAKQAKAAAKAAAAAAVAVAAAESEKASAAADPLAIGAAAKKSKQLPAGKREKAAAAGSGNVASSGSSSSDSSNSSSKNYSLSISDSCKNNNNNNNNSNTNNNNTNNNNTNNNNKNKSSSSNSSNISSTVGNSNKSDTTGSPAPEAATVAVAAAAAKPPTSDAAGDASATWNNSKYLHKKFKRLASTTETDAGAEGGDGAGKARSSSSSSSSSTTPPPAAPAPAPAPAASAPATAAGATPAATTLPATSSASEDRAMAGLTNGHRSPEQEQPKPQTQPPVGDRSVGPTSATTAAPSSTTMTTTVKSANTIAAHGSAIDNKLVVAAAPPTSAAIGHSSNSGNGGSNIKYNSSANSSNNLVPRTLSDSPSTATVISSHQQQPASINHAQQQTQTQVQQQQQHQHQQHGAEQQQQKQPHSQHLQHLQQRPGSPLALLSSAASPSPLQQQQTPGCAESAAGMLANQAQAGSPAIGGDQGGNIAGRHVCPYCNLNCTKPSVLQKHIRAHTNERPYPCDICGFAFKTKSNYYKHCRSRSHAARKRGIELPADADDGSFADSDQEQDPDLSNSSSDMISRTASPIDESSISSPAMPYQQLQYLQQQQAQQQLPLQQLSPGNVASPTPSPSSLSSTKSTYLQQPVGQQQQHQQLPLGSPAAGTLPPTTASVIGSSNAVAGVTPGGQKPVQTQAQAQSQIDYKPYKPKFHNAALYASTKAKDEAAARHHQLQQQPHHQPLEQQKPPNSVHHHLQQQQPHPQQAPPAQQPQPPPQAQPQPTHHPTLSPSTQVKLNNHINTHQLQLQLQQQQQQQLTINPANPAALPIASSPLAAVAAAAGVYYLAQPQTAAGAAAAPLLHPAAHMPQQYYNSVAAAAAAAHQQAFQAFQLMTPQQQQQFHHQLQLQQQHLQQQQQQQLQLQQQQHQHQQQQQPQHSPALMKGHHRHQASSSIQATAAQALAQQQQQQQTSLQYLANAATAVSASTSSASGSGGSNSTTSSASTATTSGLIHGNISAVAAAASSGVVQLNKEFLTEHITKLISQNEAIVENKELLLQKKYPKTLNRSRSFNNANSNNNNNSSSSSHNASSSGAAHNHSNNSSGGGSSSASNNNLVISTTIESANAKLAQAIANKQQQQQLQQQQQQLQQQQQQHYQQMQQQMLQHPPLNGISKHIAASKQIAQPPAQQLQQPHHPLKQQQLPPQPTQQYRQPQPQPQPALQQQHQHQHQQQQQQQLLLQHQQQQQQQGPMTLLLQAQHQQKEIESLAHLPPSGNVPLNLSAKSKSKDDDAHHALPSSAVAAAAPGPATPAAAPVPAPATPRKRQSSELADRSVPSSEAPASAGSSVVVAAAAGSKHPPNNSIIKNLLLNARGMAVPTGEGEDAVYICPLCSLEFRTAEDLQLHNSTYCQGASSSAPISPVSSPSYKYFRSNSISLNFPELKNSIYLSKNPLSLAKLAWSQLKTKPSSLVLSRLSASQAGTTKSSAPAAPAAGGSSAGGGASTSAAAVLDSTLRLIDAPLQSPGPLLGKTPLVDSYNHSEASRKSEDVVITKMHEDRQFSAAEAKRPKLDPGSSDQFQLHAAPGKQAAVAAAATGPRAAHGNSSGSAGNNISGGDMQLLATAASNLSADLSGSRKNEERMKRYNSSGGCMIPISECSDIDMSPKMIRTPLLSGGSFQEVSPKPKEKEPKVVLPMAGAGAQLTPKHGIAGLNLASTGPQHFQFPPINSITAFNPLTLPPMSSATMTLGEKVIPYVPGIPGPNSLTPQLPPQHLQVPAASGPNPSRGDRRALSPNRKKAASPMSTLTIAADVRTLSPFGGVQNAPSEFSRLPPSPALRAARNWSGINQAAAGITKQSATLSSLEVPKKSFNFQRIADNLSPRKSAGAAATASQTAVPKTSPPTKEVRHFNFDNISKETEIIVATSSVAGRGAPSSALTPLHVDTSAANATANPAPAAASTSSASSTTAHHGADMETSAGADVKKSKFLRPTSLPLKPGTFTPKRHHGITPTANTLPLISPETPRPSKACVQLYLNGHAYTYLGLKSSTKVFYCTVNLPQPSYVAGMHKLSMYSVWQVCAENNPHSLGLKPKVVMSLYDSRQKSITSTMAGANKLAYALVTSQHAVMTPFANNPGQFYHHQLKQIAADPANSSSNADGLLLSKEEGLTIDVNGEPVGKLDPSSSATSTGSASSQQMLVGGYESHEDYTYIRGRGRGRYVCSECGIRCKKPSMLKKHIRTHTDVRPYTCKHCNFSFKTKGNLTKHMQSKTHYKKCIELGINPGPMPADGEFLEPDMEFDQQSSTSAGGRTSSIPGESDSDDFSDNETESSDTDDTKSRLQEHEAARCLLSLSMTPPIGQSISPQLKSDVYTYQHSSIIESSAMNFAAQPTPSPSPANTTTSPHPGAIKRVVSFTSPKPPFDYQKQEQYYSNPEESKPKRSANASSTSFESSPIDLTKPRPSTTEAAAAAAKPSGSLSAHKEVLPNPSPMHTQAQIRDVIFGATTNESGFLKTLISMSDKVRTSAEGVENSKKINESILLQAYLTEQALQYTKIKQCQMSRSFLDGSSSGPSGSSSWTSTNTMAGVTTTTPSAIRATTPIWGGGGAAGSSTNSSVVVVASNSTSTSTAIMVSTASATTVITAKETVTGGLVEGSANQAVVRKHLEPSRIQEPTYDEVPELKVEPVKAAPKAASIQPPAPAVVITPSKSSDESEESECPSDQEPSSTATMKATLATSNHAPATKPSTNSSSAKEPSVSASSTASALTSSHNANLPAAVQNPGTTDFSGVLSAPARTVIVGEDGFKKSTNNEILPVYPRVPISSDGRPVCTICSKIFQKQHQLVLHMNIHYMERKFKCESCGVSFRTQGHLQKHERSEAHKNKVMMTSTFGVPTTSNPRPFECTDCKIAFRIHGHLAKHLRSKTHVQKLECLQKLPFGTYAEIERAGISLTEIDTSDCENSLISLKHLAQKLIEKDPSKLSSYTTPSGMNAMGDANSNAGLASHDSASEDGFSAAANAAATAIASLDNDSATNTPRRGNSMSEDEALGAMGPTGGLNSLKRRLPSGVLSGSGFSNGEESDNQLEAEKRPRVDSLVAASPAASSTSNASN